MNTMTYQGYTARVAFDERDALLVGRVLGVRDIISFHGETVAELRADFEAAIDDYLRDCAEQGITPEKSASGNLMLRVPPDLHAQALAAAQVAGKSLNQWAVEALGQALHTAWPMPPPLPVIGPASASRLSSPPWPETIPARPADAGPGSSKSPAHCPVDPDSSPVAGR